MEFKIVSEPFTWKDNMAELALEDFSMIQNRLSYCTCQSIGLALAKLDLMEKQGLYPDESLIESLVEEVEEDEEN